MSGVHVLCTWCGAERIAVIYSACEHCERGWMLPPVLARAWREGVRAAGGDDLGCDVVDCARCAAIRRSVQ